MNRPFNIVALSFVSLYFNDVDAARLLYSRVLGEPHMLDHHQNMCGWNLCTSWLTFLPASAGTQPDAPPCNTEFALQLQTTVEVDAIFHAFVEAGFTARMQPHDTTMYVPMRFACVDDPFGVRVDVIAML